MVEEAINSAYESIIKLIRNRRLKDAIAQLQLLLSKTNNWPLHTSLEEIATSYNYMLQYMVQGSVDPKRNELYNSLVVRLIEIADRTHIILLDMVSPILYHVIRNNINKNAVNVDLSRAISRLESATLDFSVNSLLPDNTKKLDMANEVYRAEKELFLQTWTNIYWTNEDVEAARSLFQSSTISRNDICLFVSAVTLSSLQCFDINKLIWLLDAYSAFPSPRIRQRAIIGVFFVLYSYADRIPFYPLIEERLSLMKTSTNIARDLSQCYFNFVNCWETTKINRIMTDEIMPDIIKDMNSQQFNIKDNDSDDDSDVNKLLFPHIEDKNLESKLERLTRMSMEGGDLYMSTFQNLKNFSFFHDIENWFKPFDMNQPHVIKLLAGTEDTATTILNILKGAVYLCDNDKYSLAHILPKMPLNQFNMMKAQLDEAEEAMKEEEEKNEVLTEDEKVYKLENSNYMHDLYRFFKVSPRRMEFANIFAKNIFGTDIPQLDLMLYESDNMMLLAEFLLKKKYWKEAEALYEKLIRLNKDDSKSGALYCRRGYTLQRQKSYIEAIQYYLKAEIYMTDDNWLKEQMATCYRLSGQNNEALSYYRDLEKSSPDDTSVIYHLAISLAEDKQYDEAFKCLFKLNYLNPDDIKVWRAIGWYSFVVDKFDQSRDYFNKVTAKNPVASDYLNIGHLELVQGNLKDAVAAYGQAVSLCKDKEEFVSMFNVDKALLIKKGIKAEYIPLMMDCVL